MSKKANELRSIFPNISADVLAANADHPKLSQPKERARSEEGNPSAGGPELERRASTSAVGKAKAKGRNSQRFLVRVTSIRRRLIDEDNLCEKYVVDCCRYSGILPCDSPEETRIEIRQRKAGKEEAEMTVVEIFNLPTA